MTDAQVFRLKPNTYIHVLDNNTNVTRLIVGPTTFTRLDHESVLFRPKNCITVPPRCYCRIRNPVIRDGGEPVHDEGSGQVLVKEGDEEIRFEQDPFPLYPGEGIVEEGGKLVNELQVIPKDCALRLRITRDIDGYPAGHEIIFKGPDTYKPRVGVEVVDTIKAQVVKQNEALKLRARQEFTENGVTRTVGAEWLVKTRGAYLPRVEEEVVTKVRACTLTEKVALHLEATQTFTDVYGKRRIAGAQWLVTIDDAPSHIPDVFERVVGEVPITTLTNRQYCVVLDPVDDKLQPQLGAKEVRKGEISFFLHPGEKLYQGIKDVIVLAAEEALLLRALEAHTDPDGSDRKPGDKWMIHGPCDYVPPGQVEIVERRTVMALGENEGVYVRDETTGKVRAVVGESYLLQPHECLWAKELPPIVDELLCRTSGTKHSVKDTTTPTVNRDKTKVVTFSVQHNAACQIYDYKAREARYVFGPDLVMLQPDEQFTVISLSGDKPKTPNVIQSLQLFMGPDFMTDIIGVETSDHARLQLQVSYNWGFSKTCLQDAKRLFAVPDFVGDACKAIASRIRGAVAAEIFDSFHKNSARIIRAAVFGMTDDGKIKDEFAFPSNGLCISNIDIQSVEPVDQKTRDALMKSVQMAIEITTKSQEARARHEAEQKEQEAKGELARQVIQNDVQKERARKEFLQLAAETEAIESQGSAVAEAKARAEASEIECSSEVEQARLKAQAKDTTAMAELEITKRKQSSELEYQRKLNEVELTKARKLAEIEAQKFADTVDAIGQETLLAIAQAGPETQVKLLEGLGLKGYLITDGTSPVNLFNTAKGMIGSMPGAE
eukprot:NODE_65_length_2667_cov_116.292913_g45_i0.p1 GENE.NODE_65_length_2667_cov_116.292913_g45_i0~~NODE_65_length_2667_cov_116.292913_g45_i0.p1  ORF type:complete len:833 (-),score=250.76 NODE_65_length_2667_cov_116.292913_g45_i0:97-2595(-)